MMEKLIAMVSEQLGVPAAEIKPESRLKEDLQADSASVMMLVMISTTVEVTLLTIWVAVK